MKNKKLRQSYHKIVDASQNVSKKPFLMGPETDPNGFTTETFIQTPDNLDQ